MYDLYISPQQGDLIPTFLQTFHNPSKFTMKCLMKEQHNIVNIINQPHADEGPAGVIVFTAENDQHSLSATPPVAPH